MKWGGVGCGRGETHFYNDSYKMLKKDFLCANKEMMAGSAIKGLDSQPKRGFPCLWITRIHIIKMDV